MISPLSQYPSKVVGTYSPPWRDSSTHSGLRRPLNTFSMSSSTSLENAHGPIHSHGKDGQETKVTVTGNTIPSIQDGEIRDIIVENSVQRSIVRKLDTRLLPLLSFMYLFNAIDRNNLGNAKTDSLLEDLHMTETQYSVSTVCSRVVRICSPDDSSLWSFSTSPSADSMCRPICFSNVRRARSCCLP